MALATSKCMIFESIDIILFITIKLFAFINIDILFRFVWYSSLFINLEINADSNKDWGLEIQAQYWKRLQWLGLASTLCLSLICPNYLSPRQLHPSFSIFTNKEWIVSPSPKGKNKVLPWKLSIQSGISHCSHQDKKSKPCLLIIREK